LAAVAVLMSIFVTVVVAGRTATSAAATGNCPAGSTLNVVAHEDDDILFQSPDLLHTVQSGRCVRTVYFTAGDNGESQAYWSGRETGVQSAYASMAGVANSWTTTDAGVAGHPIALMTLNGSPGISLMFMRLPDGNMDGSGFPGTGFESLQKLFTGTIATIHTVDGTSSYSKASLESTLLGLMNSFQPDSINTLDYVGSYGDGDHSDHHTVAYLTQQAQAQYATPHGFAGYQGYGIASKVSNVSGTDLTAKTSTFFDYAQFDANTCATAAACAARPEGSWFSRQYTVGTPIPPPTTTTPPPAGSNVARAATVTASSENAADGQTAVKAVDGVVDGYPGDYTKEWATRAGKAGSWLQLTWPSPVTVGSVVLFDRPNTSDQVTAGTLTFSDGSTVAVPALNNAGAGVTVTFASRSTTSLRFTVTGVSASTGNVGLAELQAWQPV